MRRGGPGEILAADVVRQLAGSRVAALMQPAGNLKLAGIAERVATCQVVGARAAARQPIPRARSPS